MNTIPATDSTVFVRWYGKTVQGKAKGQAFPGGTPLMQRMLLVEIPVQGVNVLTAFLPAHVYDSTQQASDTHPQTPSHPLSHPSFVHSSGCKPESSEPPSPTSFVNSPGCEPGSEAALRQRYRDFFAAHWDHQRNHLKVEYLQESMRLLHELEREELKARGLTAYKIPSFPKPAEKPPCRPVCCDAIATNSSQKPKPTNKQLRSTGRIQYRDTIQTSIFD